MGQRAAPQILQSGSASAHAAPAVLGRLVTCRGHRELQRRAVLAPVQALRFAPPRFAGARGGLDRGCVRRVLGTAGDGRTGLRRGLRTPGGTTPDSAPGSRGVVGAPGSGTPDYDEERVFTNAKSKARQVYEQVPNPTTTFDRLSSAWRSVLTGVKGRGSERSAAKASARETKQAEKALRTNREFRRWFHREYKPDTVTRTRGNDNPDLSPVQVRDAYRDWLDSAKPKK
jgi:hypothetical protein